MGLVPLRELVLEYLDGWPVSVNEELEAVSFPAYTDIATWVAHVLCLEGPRQLIMYSTHDEDVPARLRKRVAEFATRANHGLAIGNFELDLDGGPLRFRTSLAVGAVELDPLLVKNLVMANLAVFEAYAPGVRLLLDGASVEEAISAAEADR